MLVDVPGKGTRARRAGARRRLLERVVRVPTVDETLIGMMRISKLLYVPLAISSIKWLATMGPPGLEHPCK